MQRERFSEAMQRADAMSEGSAADAASRCCATIDSTSAHARRLAALPPLAASLPRAASVHLTGHCPPFRLGRPPCLAVLCTSMPLITSSVPLTCPLHTPQHHSSRVCPVHGCEMVPECRDARVERERECVRPTNGVSQHLPAPCVVPYKKCYFLRRERSEQVARGQRAPHLYEYGGVYRAKTRQVRAPGWRGGP